MESNITKTLGSVGKIDPKPALRSSLETRFEAYSDSKPSDSTRSLLRE